MNHPHALHSPQPHLIHSSHQHCHHPSIHTLSQYTHMQHKQNRVPFRSDHNTHQHTHCQHNFTNIILVAEKHNISKGKMHSIRRANFCNPVLKLLNEEITSDIQKHKQNIWKEHLDAHWDHRNNTHIIWKNIHDLSNRAPQPTLNTSITFNQKIATTAKYIAN